jgi:tetratricopeptide (TPR) repeat protein
VTKSAKKIELRGWLLFRLDIHLKEGPADVYMILDLEPDLILATELTLDHGLSAEEATRLIENAHKKANTWPRQMILIKGEPSNEKVEKFFETKEIPIKLVTAREIADRVHPVKESFRQHFFSPTGSLQERFKEDVSPDDRESALAAIPDSYHLCSCASGKKFKFCCKRIFREILEAMHEVEAGRFQRALKFLDTASEVVGETPEVLCRYAIVYSFFDRAKSAEYLERCLKANPKHPRANYILGIDFSEKGELKKAAGAYKRAAENYPVTDVYHLNEVLNNLGSVQYDLGHFEKAKESWEKALVLLPSDNVVRRNLRKFIYSNISLPDHIRTMSPFVAKFF